MGIEWKIKKKNFYLKYFYLCVGGKISKKYNNGIDKQYFVRYNKYVFEMSAGIAQLIERRLAKAKVAGLSPVSRSSLF